MKKTFANFGNFEKQNDLLIREKKKQDWVKDEFFFGIIKIIFFSLWKVEQQHQTTSVQRIYFWRKNKINKVKVFGFSFLGPVSNRGYLFGLAGPTAAVVPLKDKKQKSCNNNEATFGWLMDEQVFRWWINRSVRKLTLGPRSPFSPFSELGEDEEPRLSVAEAEMKRIWAFLQHSKN